MQSSVGIIRVLVRYGLLNVFLSAVLEVTFSTTVMHANRDQLKHMNRDSIHV